MLLTAPAVAHERGLSSSELTLGDAGLVSAVFTFAAADLQTSPAEFVAHGVDVRADGVSCPGTLASVQAAGGDGVELTATFACPLHPHTLEYVLYAISDGPEGARHVARIAHGDATAQAVLSPTKRAVSLEVAPREPPASGQSSWLLLVLAIVVVVVVVVVSSRCRSTHTGT